VLNGGFANPVRGGEGQGVGSVLIGFRGLAGDGRRSVHAGPEPEASRQCALLADLSAGNPVARILKVFERPILNTTRLADMHGGCPPCGRCREFIRQIDPANLDTEVVLGRTSSAKLRELLRTTNGPARAVIQPP
jgi:hypothetical protein